MHRTILRAALSLSIIGVIGGCASKEKPLYGNSTEHAQAQPPRQSMPAAKYTSYGEPMKLSDSAAVPVSTVLANPATYEGKYVRLAGSVTKVCQSKGCWLEMADPTTRQTLFVKFTCPVEGRLIPMDAMNKPVVVEGYVKVTEISEQDARHLKEESGARPEDVAKIKGPQKQITLASPAAQVAGL